MRILAYTKYNIKINIMYRHTSKHENGLAFTGKYIYLVYSNEQKQIPLGEGFFSNFTMI